MGDEKRKLVSARAREKSTKAVNDAFKAYQRWQVADCIAKDIPIDAGNLESFAAWIADEIGLPK